MSYLGDNGEGKPRKSHPLDRDYQPPPQPESNQDGPREQLVFDMESQRPIVTYALIAVNVLVFLISAEAQRSLFSFGWNDALRVFNEGEFYRLVTSMFLHAGFGHIFFNMYALYILGTQTEQMYGRLRYLSIYFLGGITGSLLSAAFGDPSIPSVGASGAVFAIFGTQILYFYRHREALGEVAQGALRQYGFLLLVNLGLGFAVPRIDNLGHIGGLIGGAILGWLLSPNLTVRQAFDHYGNRLRVVRTEQRDGVEAISFVYVLGLIGFTVIVAQFLF